MKLYEIHESIERILEQGFDYDCIDMESGEILEDKAQEKLASLEVEESIKIENIALFLKNLDADVEAIKAEEKALADRRKTKERKYDWLKDYLSIFMQHTGKARFESARTVLSFRKSEVLQVTDEDMLKAYAVDNDRYLKYTEPKLEIGEIKKAFKNGEQIPGVEIVERQNLQIK